jgi:hypothetical protein
MGTRGTIYLIRAPRGDGGWINYRTCDHQEALRVAGQFAVDVTIAVPAQRPAT